MFIYCAFNCITFIIIYKFIRDVICRNLGHLQISRTIFKIHISMYSFFDFSFSVEIFPKDAVIGKCSNKITKTNVIFTHKLS